MINYLKRIVSLLLVLLMSFQLASPLSNGHAIVYASSSHSSPFLNPFSDIETSFAQDKILVAYDFGFINGLTETRFGPKDKLTVEQFIKMLITGFNEAEQLVDKSVNAKASNWAKPYIATALDLNWIERHDFSDYTKTITREQAAYVIGKAFVSYGTNYIEGELPELSFSDASQINKKYVPYISMLEQFEVISGVTAMTFNAKGELTREQGITMLMRILGVQTVLVAFQEYYKIADVDLAFERLYSAYLLHPSRYTLNALGQMFSLGGDWATALSLYQSSKGSYGLTRETMQQLSYALHENGRSEEAREALLSFLGEEQPNTYEQALLAKYAIALDDKETFDKAINTFNNSGNDYLNDLGSRLNQDYGGSNWNLAVEDANKEIVKNGCPFGPNAFDKSFFEVMDYYQDFIMFNLSFATIALGIINPVPLGVTMNLISIGASLGYGIPELVNDEINLDEFVDDYALGILLSLGGIKNQKLVSNLENLNGAPFKLTASQKEITDTFDRTLTLQSEGIFLDSFSTTSSEAQDEASELMKAKDDYRYLEETAPDYWLGWAIWDYYLSLDRLEWYKMEYFNSKGNRERQLEWCVVIVNQIEDSIPASLGFIEYYLSKLSASSSNYQFTLDTLSMLNKDAMNLDDFYGLRQNIHNMENRLGISDEERIANDMRLSPKH